MFHHTLKSHADILVIDRGHIFRKYRHKNNQKVTLIYETNGGKTAVIRVYLHTGCYVDKERIRI